MSFTSGVTSVCRRLLGSSDSAAVRNGATVPEGAERAAVEAKSNNAPDVVPDRMIKAWKESNAAYPPENTRTPLKLGLLSFLVCCAFGPGGALIGAVGLAGSYVKSYYNTRDNAPEAVAKNYHFWNPFSWIRSENA